MNNIVLVTCYMSRIDLVEWLRVAKLDSWDPVLVTRKRSDSRNRKGGDDGVRTDYAIARTVGAGESIDAAHRLREKKRCKITTQKLSTTQFRGANGQAVQN